MELKLAVLADAANISKEGKLNILGEFNMIFARKVPVRWPLMYLVLRFEATPAEVREKHTLRITIVDQDGNIAGPTIDGELTMGKVTAPGIPYRGQFIVGVEGATFPQYGSYTFEVLVNKNHIGGVVLYIQPPPEPASSDQ